MAENPSWKILFQERSGLVNCLELCTILHEMQAQEMIIMSWLLVFKLLEARFNLISYQLYVSVTIEISNIEERI